jgi:hypothetical protein
MTTNQPQTDSPAPAIPESFEVRRAELRAEAQERFDRIGLPSPLSPEYRIY